MASMVVSIGTRKMFVELRKMFLNAPRDDCSSEAA
jgi:hypothetical protein